MHNYLSRLLEPNTNGPEIAILISKLLGVNVTATTLTKEIEEHPDYPSLLSLSDVLNTHGIENLGVKLTPEMFFEAPVPFVTQLEYRDQELKFFSVVKKIDSQIVEFFDPEKHDWVSISTESFFKIWTGVVLLIEVTDGAGEDEYYKKVRQEGRKRNGYYLKTFAIPTLVALSVIMTIIQYGSLFLLPFVYVLVTIGGLGTGVLLLWYELDQHNPVLQQICSAGKKTNCSAVLRSSAAYIGGISWSAIGFSYFLGLLIFLVIGGINRPEVQFIVFCMNAATLPYTIFSFYYQWKVAKEWCIMCLFTQTVLITQFTLAVYGGWYEKDISAFIITDTFVKSLLAFVVPLISTCLLLPALKMAKKSKQLNIELQKLKHNTQIFEALLQKQKMLDYDPTGLGITLGNTNGAYKVIKVCNPYCGPCAMAHKPMEDLLRSNPEVQLQILFNATNDEKDSKSAPVKHFLAVAEKYDEVVIQNALDSWYFAKSKNYAVFASKYPMNGELQKQSDKIDAMQRWCKNVDIRFTPTFFISIPEIGNQTPRFFQLPNIYNVDDLKYFFSK